MTITITALHPNDAYYPDREDFIGLTVDASRIEPCGDEWYSVELAVCSAFKTSLKIGISKPLTHVI